MKSTDNVGITFANLVLARGILNGVVNITLGAYEFNPPDTGDKIEPSPVIVSRLRMDVAGARALRDNLNELLVSLDAPAAGVVAEGEAAAMNGAAKH